MDERTANFDFYRQVWNGIGTKVKLFIGRGLVQRRLLAMPMQL